MGTRFDGVPIFGSVLKVKTKMYLHTGTGIIANKECCGFSLPFSLVSAVFFF